MPDTGISPVEGGVGGVALLAAGWLAKRVEEWWKARKPPQTQAERDRDAADLDAQSVETASRLMVGMRDDLNALRGVVAAQGREIAELKSSHAECEERCTALSGEVRQLQAAKRSMERLLTKLKKPEATNIGGELEGAIFEMKDGGVEDVSGRPTIDKENP